ncbi:cytochrome P450 [Xylariomycetidae sp. FL2044]|nr:cytochrome P450 [Xylariomycetidae sp. FL2044]
MLLAFHSPARSNRHSLVIMNFLYTIITLGLRLVFLRVKLLGLRTPLIFIYTFYTLARTTYNNLIQHGLASVPGPLLNRVSDKSKLYHVYHDTLAAYNLSLHRKYGPVVRVAPNELSLAGDASILFQSSIVPSQPQPQPQPRPPNTLRDRDARPWARLSPDDIFELDLFVQGYTDVLLKRLKQHCLTTYDDEAESSIELTPLLRDAVFNMLSGLRFCASDLLDEDECGAGERPGIRILHELGLRRLIPLVRLFWPVEVGYVEHALPSDASSISSPGPVFGKAEDEDEEEGEEQKTALPPQAVVLGNKVVAALKMTLTLLMYRPEVLTRARHELRARFHSDAEIAALSLVDPEEEKDGGGELVYFRACVREALRCCPGLVDDGVARWEVVKEAGVKIGRWYVPAGTRLSISQTAICHDKKLFTNPRSLEPDRWLGKVPKYQDDRIDVVRMLDGLGDSLSNTMMRVLLARLIWNYDIQPVGPRPEGSEEPTDVRGWGEECLHVYLTSTRR